jgi:hypothetical protein
MSIQFGAIHNLVRTYQRVLNLESSAQTPEAAAAEADDRVSISKEARQLQQGAAPSGHQASSPRR